MTTAADSPTPASSEMPTAQQREWADGLHKAALQLQKDRDAAAHRMEMGAVLADKLEGVLTQMKEITSLAKEADFPYIFDELQRRAAFWESDAKGLRTKVELPDSRELCDRILHSCSQGHEYIATMQQSDYERFRQALENQGAALEVAIKKLPSELQPGPREAVVKTVTDSLQATAGIDPVRRQ